MGRQAGVGTLLQVLAREGPAGLVAGRSGLLQSAQTRHLPGGKVAVLEPAASWLPRQPSHGARLRWCGDGVQLSLQSPRERRPPYSPPPFYTCGPVPTSTAKWTLLLVGAFGGHSQGLGNSTMTQPQKGPCTETPKPELGSGAGTQAHPQAPFERLRPLSELLRPPSHFAPSKSPAVDQAAGASVRILPGHSQLSPELHSVRGSPQHGRHRSGPSPV